MNAAGTYEFELKLTNDLGDMGSDRIKITNIGGTVLPVSFTYFTGKAVNEKNRLQWGTASEMDNDRFEILRAADGIDFEQIGVVTSKGTANNSTAYNFDDNSPLKNINYYELRQVDKNEKSTVSSVITVRSVGKRILAEVFPNPAKNVLTLKFKESFLGNIRTTIAYMQGRLLHQQVFRKSTFSFQETLPVDTLQNGVYQLIVQYENGKKEVRSFFKN
jgi:hypothetical protein